MLRSFSQHYMKQLQWLFSIMFFITIFALLCFHSATGLAENAEKISTLSTNISKALGGFASILQNVSLVCGIGFILVSFFKFHQHKLNPTQVPISQAITLLVIGACLTVFPHLIETPATAITGSGNIATLSGKQITGIIGSG